MMIKTIGKDLSRKEKTDKLRIISLVRACPQLIKKLWYRENWKKAGIKEILVHSGQHYDVNMSEVFFKVLNIKRPDHFLNVGSGNHGEMTGKIMIKI